MTPVDGTLARVCGRYAASRDADALVETLADLGVDVGRVDDEARAVAPSFNVAPTQQRLVLARDARSRAAATEPSDEPAAEPPGGAGPDLRVAALAWGLVPSWSTDRRGAARMINARVESVPQRPAYRGLLATRRCLVPMDGWFEWRAVPSGRKQPYVVRPDGGSLLLVAGLYTWWRDPAGSPDPATGRVPWFGSYTVLTAPARPDLSWLHDRMPLAVVGDRWHDWLGEAAEPRSLLDALRSDLADTARLPLAWHAVDRRVGSVAQDDPSLLAPVEPDTETPPT